jgi:hypothetical protein
VLLRGCTENKKRTDLFLKLYNIQMIPITLYNATGNGVIEQGYRPITDASSNLTASSAKPKEMCIDHLPVVLCADGITIRGVPGYLPFHLMFSHGAVLQIERENVP